MFANSLALVEDAALTHLHVFPYSIRPGTPAAKMPQVNGAVIKQRAAQLRATGEKAFAQRLESFVGKTVTVLMEKPDLGRSDHYIPVRFDTPQVPGEVVTATIIASGGDLLRGTSLSGGTLP
jgi:threonylcarbamoyladenosine tRNA methylthiotransferase MtaB